MILNYYPPGCKEQTTNSLLISDEISSNEQSPQASTESYPESSPWGDFEYWMATGCLE